MHFSHPVEYICRCTVAYTRGPPECSTWEHYNNSLSGQMWTQQGESAGCDALPWDLSIVMHFLEIYPFFPVKSLISSLKCSLVVPNFLLPCLLILGPAFRVWLPCFVQTRSSWRRLERSSSGWRRRRSSWRRRWGRRCRAQSRPWRRRRRSWCKSCPVARLLPLPWCRYMDLAWVQMWVCDGLGCPVARLPPSPWCRLVDGVWVQVSLRWVVPWQGRCHWRGGGWWIWLACRCELVMGFRAARPPPLPWSRLVDRAWVQVWACDRLSLGKATTIILMHVVRRSLSSGVSLWWVVPWQGHYHRFDACW